jgi:hypothetical protein
MAWLSPSVLSKKTLEGGRPQDELTRQPNHRCARGLRGSWTLKETEYVSTRYGRQSTEGYAQGSRLSADRCAIYELDGDAR